MKRGRIERLLRVRVLQEEVARAAWRAAERSAAEAEERNARGVQAAREEREALGRRMERSGITPAAILAAHAALDGMDAHARRWRERARTLRFQAQQARAPWEERRRDARALEKLCDRARALEAREEHTQEAAVLDEVAGRRAARGAKGHRT